MSKEYAQFDMANIFGVEVIPRARRRVRGHNRPALAAQRALVREARATLLPADRTDARVAGGAVGVAQQTALTSGGWWVVGGEVWNKGVG